MPQSVQVNSVPTTLQFGYIDEAAGGQMNVLDLNGMIPIKVGLGSGGQNYWIGVATLRAGLSQTVVAVFNPIDRGIYSPTAQYSQRDQVKYQGATYFFFGTTPATGQTPPGTSWSKISEDGISAVAFTTNTSAVVAPAINSSFVIDLGETRGLNETVRYQFGSLGQATLVSKTTTQGTFTNNTITASTSINSGILISPAQGLPGAAGTNGISPGHRYTVSTSAPTANGLLQVASDTSLVIRNTDLDGVAPVGISTTLPIDSQIWIQDAASISNRRIFTTTALPTLASNNFTVTGTSTLIGTLPTTAGGVRVLVFPGGASSGSGVGSGLRFQYDSNATIADNFGAFARNGASFAAATQLSFSIFEDQTNNADTVDILQRLTIGAIFEVRKSATAWTRYRSTGIPTLDTSGIQDCYNVAVTSEAVGPDAIANTDTIYLSILSDALATNGIAVQDEGTAQGIASILNFTGSGVTTTFAAGVETVNIPGITSGSDLIWSSPTISQDLLVKHGYYLNSNGLIHTSPQTHVLGDQIILIGENGWSVTGANFRLPNGTQNTGIRSIPGNDRAVCHLISLGAPVFMILQQVGVELYTPPIGGLGGTIATNFQTIYNATGNTLSTIEFNAIGDFVNAIENHSTLGWSDNIAGFWPFLGTNNASQIINAANPGTGDLTNSTGTITYNASNGATVGTSGGSLWAGSTFIAGHWSASNFRGIILAVSNFVTNQTNFGSPRPIWGLQGFNNSYVGDGNAASVLLSSHSNPPPLTISPSVTSPFNGRLSTYSISSGSQVIDRAYINGIAQNTYSPSTKTNIVDWRPLTCNSVNSPSNVTIRGILLLKSVTGFSLSEITAIETAYNNFLIAIGRS